jgi:YlmC/YmxH family sporulation protein
MLYIRNQVGIAMRICELHNKQVINSCDGRILGFVMDVEFDQFTGCIHAIIVPGPTRFCGFFGRDIEYVIPFKCIRCIGEDTVIVDVNIEKIVNKCT